MQVKWRVTEDDSFQLSSVSSDGRVVGWTIVKNELQFVDMVVLRSDPDPADASVFSRACGTCLAFCPANPMTFLVGTEDGAIRLCSAAYGSTYLRSFLVRSGRSLLHLLPRCVAAICAVFGSHGQSHGMAVYNVEWNPFHPRVRPVLSQPSSASLNPSSSLIPFNHPLHS
jgi:hypothetical protein